MVNISAKIIKSLYIRYGLIVLCKVWLLILSSIRCRAGKKSDSVMPTIPEMVSTLCRQIIPLITVPMPINIAVRKKILVWYTNAAIYINRYDMPNVSHTALTLRSRYDLGCRVFACFEARIRRYVPMPPISGRANHPHVSISGRLHAMTIYSKSVTTTVVYPHSRKYLPLSRSMCDLVSVIICDIISMLRCSSSSLGVCVMTPTLWCYDEL